MNVTQVIKECKRRWGPTGNAQINRRVKLSHTVGRVRLGVLFEVQGQGATWEEAFEDADRKTAADRERLTNLMKAREEARHV